MKPTKPGALDLVCQGLSNLFMGFVSASLGLFKVLSVAAVQMLVTGPAYI